MTVVDASVWVAGLLWRDIHHGASRAWLEDQTQRQIPLIAPWIMVPEVAGAAARRAGRPALGHTAIRYFSELVNSGYLELVQMDAELSTRSAILAADLGIRGADSIDVALAVWRQVPLVTWDREQQLRAGNLISVMTPSEALASGL